jgi:hypothetical protein
MYDYYLGKPKRLDLLFAEMGKGWLARMEGFFGARILPLSLVLRLGQLSEQR